MNAMLVITPRSERGVWLFDDSAAGLEREPFVAGIPEMIDRLVAGIPNAETGFSMIFSAQDFPGSMVRLDLDCPEHGGNWYYASGWGLRGWLCPALFAYFTDAPQTIFVKAEAIRSAA